MAARKEASKTKPRRRLGRGLSSLISAPVSIALPDPPPTPDARPTADESPPVSERSPSGDPTSGIPIGDIRPNPKQPRQRFDERSIETLAASIRTAGVMQPIIVRPCTAGGFELVAGERRWRAARRAGLEYIPAVVRTLDDQQAAEWSLVENLQREDLNPIERAEAFQRLLDEFHMTHQEIAEDVGLDRSNVSNHLRLLELDDELKQLVREGLLSHGHARASLAITNGAQRRRLVLKSIREGWSVRELERRARVGGKPASSAPRPTAPRQANLRDLERKLGDSLGTRVSIKSGRKKGSGTLTIAFYDFDQFEGLLDRLGVRCD